MKRLNHLDLEVCDLCSHQRPSTAIYAKQSSSNHHQQTPTAMKYCSCPHMLQCMHNLELSPSPSGPAPRRTSSTLPACEKNCSISCSDAWNGRFLMYTWRMHRDSQMPWVQCLHVLVSRMTPWVPTKDSSRHYFGRRQSSDGLNALTDTELVYKAQGTCQRGVCLLSP